VVVFRGKRGDLLSQIEQLELRLKDLEVDQGLCHVAKVVP
jgi:hypothetical protein